MTRRLATLAGTIALVASACASPVPTVPVPTATPTPSLAATPTAPTSSAAAPTQAATFSPSPAAVAVRSAAPEYCVAPEKGPPQDIVTTPASPYFVRQPAKDDPNVPTIIYFGGGSGSRRSAERVWANYLSGGKGVDEFRAIMPYSKDVEFYDYYEARRTYRVLDEVLACYGGDPAQVHIAGFSNGGYVAFELMLEHPERFATLLGAPGLFPQPTTPEQWAKSLRGKPVFNGVGALDTDWKPDVQATHEGLVKVGIASLYVEFDSQKHGLNPAFDETVFFDFWRGGQPRTANPDSEESRWQCE